ncbi:MAG: glycosyltransferase family 4 protein [Candidatus Portnoybacteria bacterium]|nr:glycosyltransferase family 4 protein [Candidatus Portnoybacteria bacterium]MDD4982489.1 glycosyltransferase family 4 protein [Candidatus Portnoybacteria bacterium]
MKIGFLINNLDLKNGWGNYSANLISALKKEGVEAVVLSGKIGYWQAKKAFKRCEAIHCLTEPQAFLASLVAGNRPFFITAHGTYAVEPLARGGWRGFKLRWAYKKASAVFCVSRFTQTQIKKLAPDTKTAVINNGVDFARFQLSIEPEAQFKELLAGRFPVILGVGAVKERKGYHLSLAALSVLKEKYPDLLYLIAGKTSDEQYLKRLKELVGHYGLESNVKFITPGDEQLVALYQAADIFLLTPVSDSVIFEGYGLVYLEAGAAGRPSVGSLNCGAEDAIIDGQTGFLVDSANEASIVRALLKLTQDQGLREQMGRSAKDVAKQRTWDRVAEEYLKIYNKFGVILWESSDRRI